MRAAVLLIAGATWLSAAAPVAAADSPRPDIPGLCQRIKPAFVFIGGGGGAIVSPEGWTLTNSHVVGDRKQFDVRSGAGRRYRARLLGRDPSGDLALLQMELKPRETVPYVQIGDPETIQVGDRVLAVGNPLGEGFLDHHPAFTLGVVSGLNQATDAEADAVATDAALNPGSSGGPLVDMAGRLVGINRQIVTRWGLPSNSGLGYAISARQIRLWLPHLARAGGGEVPHGRLAGVEFDDDDAPGGRVPRITDIAAGSRAAQAGLQVGDRITRLDGRPIAGALGLARTIPIYPLDQEVAMTVQRDGKSVDLKVRLSPSKPGELGFTLAEPRKDDEHLRIGGLDKDSPGLQAGLQPGDEILKIEQIELNVPLEMQSRLFDAWLKHGVNAGDIARLTIRRKGPDGKPFTREVRLVAK